MSGDLVRILLVEDNPGDARLIRETLREVESFRCDLVEVDRLSRAREVLAAESIHLILLDLSLPDAHGLETIEQTLLAAPDHPIVVLTGLNDENVAMQAVQAGAQDYLVKGQVDPGLLVRAVRYAMERKRVARERQRLLEREQEARAEAEAAVRARDEVLRVVSHDLGNSLSAVGIHATLLERLKPEAITPETIRNRAGAIRKLVEQMHRLRQDLLDVASIEAGRLSMHPHPQPLHPVVREAAETLEELTSERDIQLVLDVPDGLPEVQADRQRLLQVFFNLLGNAVKFTEPGGRITLRARCEGAAVRFEVEDTGPGIEPGHLERIFDRFWKGRQADRQGAGLGLSIARGIVEAHGGRIGVESEVGVGTTFHFTMPVAGGSPADADDGREASPARPAAG